MVLVWNILGRLKFSDTYHEVVTVRVWRMSAGFHCCVLRLICMIREVTTIGAEDFRCAVHHSHTGVCARTITSPEDQHRVDSGITRLFCPVGIAVDIVRGTCGGGTWSHSLRAKVALAYNSGFVLKSGTVSVSELRLKVSHPTNVLL